MNEVVKVLGKVAVTVDKNAWDNTKSYSKLTIVKNVDADNGTIDGVYISIKDVPVSTAITNEDYWFNLIPPATVLTSTYNPDWNAVSGPEQILNKPTIPSDVLQYVVQSLTDGQKEQARSNIGAIPAPTKIKITDTSDVRILGNTYNYCANKITSLKLTAFTPSDGLYSYLKFIVGGIDVVATIDTSISNLTWVNRPSSDTFKADKTYLLKFFEDTVEVIKFD